MEEIKVYYITEYINSDEIAAIPEELIEAFSVYKVNVGFLSRFTQSENVTSDNLTIVNYIKRQDYTVPGDYVLDSVEVPLNSIIYWSADKNAAVQKCKQLNSEFKTKANNTLKIAKQFIKPVEDVAQSKLNLENTRPYNAKNIGAIVAYVKHANSYTISTSNTYFTRDNISITNYMKAYLLTYTALDDIQDESITIYIYDSTQQGDYRVDQITVPYITTDLSSIQRACIDNVRTSMQLVVEVCESSIKDMDKIHDNNDYL